jgi:hypothetical protein
VLSLRLPLRSFSSRGFVLEKFFCSVVACSRTITVRLAHRITGARGGALLGRSVFRARGDRSRRNLRGVRLTSLGRRVLRRPGGVLVQVRIAERNVDGAHEVRGFTTRLALGRP